MYSCDRRVDYNIMKRDFVLIGPRLFVLLYLGRVATSSLFRVHEILAIVYIYHAFVYEDTQQRYQKHSYS